MLYFLKQTFNMHESLDELILGTLTFLFVANQLLIVKG